MSGTQELMNRLDAEFHSVEERIKKFQAEKTQEFEGREQRLEQFSALCEKLSDVWKPRLDALAQKFKDRIQVTPSVGRTRRAGTFRFHSPLARFDMTLSAMTDVDVRHLVLDYTLDVSPILMNFEKHCQLELPLDKVDPETVGKWVDDRIVDAVRAYLQMHQNANYLKGHLVTDPVANVEFPKYAAAATLDWNGKTYHFIGAETRDEFAKKNKIAT